MRTDFWLVLVLHSWCSPLFTMGVWLSSGDKTTCTWAHILYDISYLINPSFSPDFTDFIHSEDPITIIHYQLLCFVTRRPVTMDNWMMVAAKLAYTTGNIKETSDYEDYDLEQRLKLCKVPSICVCVQYRAGR